MKLIITFLIAFFSIAGINAQEVHGTIQAKTDTLQLSIIETLPEQFPNIAIIFEIKGESN